MGSEKITTVARFGPFRLDLRSGELLKGGERVQLPEQPFRILELLIARPEEIVTREEIRRRLWPNGTVVEFENAVNAAIKKLRAALGDSADEPRYIETLKRRGYRLIVPVEGSAENVPATPGPDGSEAVRQPITTIQDSAGRRVSHYRVLHVIGAGGMGVVYRAEDTKLGRPVALKFLPDELSMQPLALERLRSEARSASTLNHPNICTIYEIGDDSGQPFIAMELLEGRTLREKISGQSVPPMEAVGYGLQIADGLRAAHRKGVLHRDIKPANLFITNQGLIKILDFGLAQATPSDTGDTPEIAGERGNTSASGQAAGTLAYMSPEQLRRETLDVRSDLFSFGVVLYEMVTGNPPFHGASDADLAQSILYDSPPPPIRLNSKLPSRLDRIIRKCMEKNRDLRYAQASEIAVDLQRVRDDLTTANKRRLFAFVAAAIALLAGAGTYFFLHHGAKLTDRDSIVIADFINKTGDSVFDGTLREGLAVQLGQSPFLSVVPEDRIRQSLRLMNQSADAKLTSQLAREVCERIGSAAVLEGSIARLGTQYVLGLRTHGCRNGDVIDDQQVQVASKEEVLAALSTIARKFRSKAGESLATIRQHDVPLQEATTPSLEALKVFNLARQTTFSMGTAATVPLFKRAIEIDPQFAMAYATLGLTYGALGESELSAEYATKAYLLRDHTSEREKFFISVNYDREVTRNLERAEQNCELWEHAYPRDSDAPALASGFISQGVGNYEQSIEQAKRAIQLDPDHTFAQVNLAAGYFFLNRFEEAKEICARFSKRNQVFPEIVLIRYNIAFLQDDAGAMQQQATLAKGKPGAEDWLAHSEALVLARSGKAELAQAMSRRAIDVAQQSGQRERAASYEAATALWEAYFGNEFQATRHAAVARALSMGRDVEYASALALALSGEYAKASALMNDLEKRFTEDTSVKFTYVPTLRAALALHGGDPGGAIEALTAAQPYELGMSGISFFGFFGGLYPAYLRGEAYLALHRWREAEMEFQKILDHPGIVIADPIGALVHLQLGRAYMMSGDNGKGRAAYQKFLALWRDADSDIPILKQAKAEYARDDLTRTRWPPH
jgi:eukaryotic-like serine/threonine-protein kinase